MKYRLLLVPALYLAACSSGDRCRQTAPGFEQLNPGSVAYRQALEGWLRAGNAQRFYLEHWADSGKEMILQVQGRNGCVLMPLDTGTGTGLEAISRARGGGYRGAELSGLDYEIQGGGNNRPVFVYRSVASVRD